PRQLVVVAGARHVDVRQRIHVQDVHAGLIQPVGGNAPDDSARLEAAGGVGGAAGARQARILDEGERVAVVVGRLREVAGALERGREAKADDVATAGAGRVLVRVEEEELVVPAGTPDGAADRIPEV